jgi:hypothetical protein
MFTWSTSRSLTVTASRRSTTRSARRTWPLSGRTRPYGPS